MSTIKISHGESTPRVSASLLPMHIKYSGSANTADYFTPSHTTEKQNDGSQVDTVYFRGRRLVVGKQLNLEKLGVEGFIVNSVENLVREENEADGSEVIKTVKSFQATASFDSFTLYGHDEEAESNKQWAMIPEFLQVSKILHE
ncbi:hypothetical protein KGF56_001578 [Candida oxycetoniae]|uniref:Uncharacterized protein n=1 Tax=Candida oxycetoniae TaxID=497107 RepID=A0AAI9WZ57_9ASCO|nr:uncharacterized protein KGF56_001578 [Candida oxycetoniae]KAI3405560.2 hypothetical protein KGF56_001578 [Candida oxycetoniae]